MGGYLRGAAINGVIIGILTWIALVGVGLDYALPLAGLAAVGELVPYVGPLLAAIPGIAVGILESPTQAVTVAIVYLVLQQIEGHLVTPLVMRGQTHAPPGLVVFSLAAGFTVLGVLGALTAIPIAAALRLLVLRVAAPRLRLSARRR